MQRTRESYLSLINQLNVWSAELSLSNEMYAHEAESEVVWFVVHAKDALGGGTFVRYFGEDKSFAENEKERLISLGLEVFMFSTDGVSGADVGILQGMFNLSPVGLIYTILHENIHELLHNSFFEGLELANGYRDRDISGQIDEGLATYLGLLLAQSFISEYFPALLSNFELYSEALYSFSDTTKKLIETRIADQDETAIREKIKDLYFNKKSLEYIVVKPDSTGFAGFNGAYIGLVKRYVWILRDLQFFFERNEITVESFIKDPKKVRKQIWDLASKANR